MLLFLFLIKVISQFYQKCITKCTGLEHASLWVPAISLILRHAHEVETDKMSQESEET